MHEIAFVECYTKYLKEHGVTFYNNGFPILQSQWFVKKKPTIIVPYNKKQYFYQNKQDISICYFIKDEYLYPRLEKIFKEIEVLRQYHSVCMMDISISPLMPDEVQRMNLLLNLLFICTIAVNNIKIIPSFRTGNFETLLLLIKSVGHSKYWIMGSLGTQKIKKQAFFDYLFKTKCLMIMPKKLLSYGRPNDSTIKCLKDYGIECIVYEDFRTFSYSGRIRYGGF